MAVECCGIYHSQSIKYQILNYLCNAIHVYGYRNQIHLLYRGVVIDSDIKPFAERIVDN